MLSKLHRTLLIALLALSSAMARADASEEVVRDLTYCMGFFTAMSVVVPASKKTDMEAVSSAFLALAIELAQADEANLKKAIVDTADRVAASVVRRSAEERFAVNRQCAPYLAAGGVGQAVAPKNK